MRVVVCPIRFTITARLTNGRARGSISHYQYDPVSGMLVREIHDVDTTQMSDEPTGWATVSGWGQHVVTDYAYDAQGRLTQVLGPEHTAVVNGAATTVRTAQWFVYQESSKPASGTWIESEVWQSPAADEVDLPQWPGHQL